MAFTVLLVCDHCGHVIKEDAQPALYCNPCLDFLAVKHNLVVSQKGKEEKDAKRSDRVGEST